MFWMPNKRGLGYAKVFDMVNAIYGENFYRYEFMLYRRYTKC